MKKVILLSILLIFMTGTISAKHRFDFLEGKYGNYRFDTHLTVKSIKGGVKVKGIPGHRGWHKFYVTRRNVLREDHGNHRLIINNRNSIRLQHGRRGHSMYFTRIRGKNKRDHDDYWRYDGRRGYGDEPYYRDDYRGRKDYPYSGQRKGERNYGYDQYGDSYSNMIGEWYSNDLRKLVIIERDNNGIKARLSGSKKWTAYRPGSRGNFVDKKGNVYFLETLDKLIWEDRSGKNRYILSRS